MEQAQELLRQKAALEGEIRDLDLELRTHGVDRTEALVDADGFPRSDVDIVAIRTVRRSLNCKQNDLRALMTQIETRLLALHQTTMADATDSPEKSRLRPFARVSIVTPNSPASEAGLVAGDKIVRYGSVTADSPAGFKALSTETINNINQSLPVTIERVANGRPQTIDLTLHLRHGWGGESLLGCHILPLDT